MGLLLQEALSRMIGKGIGVTYVSQDRGWVCVATNRHDLV